MTMIYDIITQKILRLISWKIAELEVVIEKFEKGIYKSKFWGKQGAIRNYTFKKLALDSIKNDIKTEMGVLKYGCLEHATVSMWNEWGKRQNLNT